MDIGQTDWERKPNTEREGRKHGIKKLAKKEHKPEERKIITGKEIFNN